jgi:hypothetical protein
MQQKTGIHWFGLFVRLNQDGLENRFFKVVIEIHKTAAPP